MTILRACLVACLLCIASVYTSALVAQVETQGFQVVKLDVLLSTGAESALKAEGIEILHYYGNQTYLLSGLPTSVKSHQVELSKQKGELAKGISASGGEEVEVDLILAHASVLEVLLPVLAKAGFKANEEQVLGGISISGVVSADQLEGLLANPLILNATPLMDEVVPYNLEGRIAQGVTPLNSGIAGAPNLNGEGVVLGIGDGGKLSGHPDIGDRVIHSTSYYNTAWGNHPDMVAGIMAGTGSIFSDRRGVACEAELVIESSSSIIYFAPTHLNQFQMSITNNSYGPSFHCNTANKYYGVSANVDQQLFDNPALLHVYAVGNSGSSSCNGLPTGYANMPGGGQVAKNTLSVGNANFDRTRYSGSSAGPTFDGRLKPEIMAIGRSVTSNNRSGGYSTGTGTSYASPGVAGILGLLTQRYKELNGGVLPDGALLKAIACNTAEDIGPVGPDFQHGFGLINGVKALVALENSTYHEGALGQGLQYAHTVTTTASTERVKFLLYWPDQAGTTTNTASTLVNDFDLKVVTPAGDTIRPWVLDPLNPASLAVQGIDSLNNIEQVTIDAPIEGVYDILVDGKEIPLGSTDFVLSWVIQEPEVMITCPFGGESLTPNESTYIAWGASPGQTGTWKIEYNVDGGNWQTIQAGIANDARHIKWIPTVENAVLEFRVTNETTSLFDETNEPAYVIGKPQNVVGEPICDGGVLLSWAPVTGASSYKVFKFDGSEMVVVGTVTSTGTVIGSLEEGVDSLFSVAAISFSGIVSQRAYAVNQVSVVGGAGCLSPLPVEWVSIEANSLGADVEIEWTVASEFDNERFEVLRSTSGLDWAVIGQVDGRGTAPSAMTYSFLDENSEVMGISYYRIKQVDFDGASELSEIVAHEATLDEIEVLTTITLVENPVTDFIQLTSSNEVDVEMGLFDIAGRELSSFQLQPGANRIPMPTDLKAGVYLLQSGTAQGAVSLKLMKR